MTPEFWIGLGLSLVAGIMSGNCMLPSKFIHHWKWENMWLAFTLVSLVVAPWLLALTRVEDIQGTYASMSTGQLGVPFLFGFGWGIAQVLFGISIARLGLALGYAVIVGLGALLGTLVPLLFQRRDILGTGKGVLILSGVALMVVGIAVSGWAGRLREKTAAAAFSQPIRTGSGSYGAALLIAVICGLMAPMINFSFAFGQDIAREAAQRGNTAANAAYAVWPVGLAGGLIPNLAYSVYLLFRNNSWKVFRTMRPDVWLAGLMGVLWMGAVAVYGMSASYLGPLGTSAGWALFQIFMIMAANLSGVLTGEWRKASGNARSLLLLGLCLLAVATAVISLGNRGS